MYDHRDKTKFTLRECEEAVGKRVSITLEGTISEARESIEGPFVFVKIDERFGFSTALGVDLDLLEVKE